MNADASDRTIAIDYTNWQGKRRWRIINPIECSLVFGSNEWHKEQQWLFEAIDLETGWLRSFALNSIHAWRKATPNDLM